MDLPELTSISRLALKPGDVIVISCPGRLTESDMYRMKEVLRAHIPEANKILILDSGLTLDVVTPDPQLDRDGAAVDLLRYGFDAVEARRIVSGE